MSNGFSSFSKDQIDTTLFQVAPVRMNFKMALTSEGKIEVHFTEQLRKIELKKQHPKAFDTSGSLSRSSSPKSEPVAEEVPTNLPDTLSTGDSLVADTTLKTHTEISAPLETGIEGRQFISQRTDWVVGVLLFSLLLMAIIKFSYGKFLSKVIDSLFNYQVASNLFKEKNMTNLRGAIFMNLLFFVNTTVFIVVLINQFHTGPLPFQGIQLFFLCFLGLLGLYLIKFVGFGIIGQVFKGPRESREYIHTVFLFNKNLGLFLFPIIVSSPFIAPYAVPLLLQLGIAMAGFFYLLRLMRGLKILFKKHVPIFYMILYLCALEILPLLMIYKSLALLG